MKKIVVTSGYGDHVITANTDKEMMYEPGMLQHGILAINEVGPSGKKIAAYRNWEFANFVDGDTEYTITKDTF